MLFTFNDTESFPTALLWEGVQGRTKAIDFLCVVGSTTDLHIYWHGRRYGDSKQANNVTLTLTHTHSLRSDLLSLSSAAG